MDDASERRHRSGDLFEKRMGGFSVGDVERFDQDLCAAATHEFDRLARLLGRGAGATDENEMTRAALDQPVRRREAKAAEPAGDEMRALRVDREGAPLEPRIGRAS